MNTAVMFGKASDEWETPQEFFDELDAEFRFKVDAAARAESAKCSLWMGPGSPYRHDALSCLGWRWGGGPIFLNPPYSKCRQFVARAAKEAAEGATVVMLVPARTCTRWWHEHVWDTKKHRPRRNVQVRFVKGRLKFGISGNSAPFPSVVIVFRKPA